jgi:hypothetical protein
MSQLTDDEVINLFSAGKIVDVPTPKYAVGGATMDDNREPGFASGDPLARAMQNELYKSDLSVPPLMEGGRRKRRRSRRKQKGGRRSGNGGKKPRFQLTLKATVRLRSRSRQQK